MTEDPDWPIRVAAFEALRRIVAQRGPILPWAAIDTGFSHARSKYRFANQSKGIFRPKGMVGAALSIKTTVSKDPSRQRYADLEGEGAFSYAFQDRGLDYHDNQLLVRAERASIPFIYFYGVEPGVYRPMWPAYVARIDTSESRYSIVVADADAVLLPPGGFVAEPSLVIERRYSTSVVKRRLHQDLFRHVVLAAYDERCAICGLPRRELLQASHIVPDRDVRGHPSTPNGLALCSLHHSAYDANLVGVRPDLVVEVSQRLMQARDGPTLEHALKGFDGGSLRLPTQAKDHPSPENLRIRYAEFKRTA